MLETKFFTYKGLPLVRKGKTIYYGDMNEEFVVMMNITSAHKVKELDVSDNIKITLTRTAQDIDAKDMVVKSSDRNGLYDALDVAYIWLNKKKETA